MKSNCPAQVVHISSLDTEAALLSTLESYFIDPTLQKNHKELRSYHQNINAIFLIKDLIITIHRKNEEIYEALIINDSSLYKQLKSKDESISIPAFRIYKSKLINANFCLNHLRNIRKLWPIDQNPYNPAKVIIPNNTNNPSAKPAEVIF